MGAGDFELGLVRYAPDAVLTTGDGLLTTGGQTRARLDFERSYRGRDGVGDFVRTFQEAFGDQSYEPKWLVDLGEGEFVMLLHASLHGRASGAEVAQLSAHRLQIRNGWVMREEVHVGPADDWEPVVRAVGLDPADLSQAERLNAIGHEA